MSALSADDLARYRARLQARLRELDSRLHVIDDELQSHDTNDWEDLATEREDDEVLESLSEEAREEARAIYAALDRMRKGEYGICVTCGQPISRARLDILPATPFCRDCAP